MTQKLLVHMVGNAHLDPVWMWRKPDGVDEAIATCRSACDLLDLYPDLHITRGEAWVYHQIERISPKLFARMAAHIADGRWHVVNGWWIQPDCNLPSAESFRKQSEIGGAYFQSRFGVAATVGYNPDSFGHCAMLPTFLREGGKDAYLFTRPGEHERSLPADLFRWRSPAGDEVTAFRAAGYANGGIDGLKGGVERTLSKVAPGVRQALCMYGIGDHGGGPTRNQIEWILAHRDYSLDVELRFSHPRAFFDAIAADATELPLVEGELHYHAIGSYTAVRALKREARRAETLLVQAEQLAKDIDTTAVKDGLGDIEANWQTVLFNQFHDIMGGSSLRSASDDALDELGGVKAFSRDLQTLATRTRNLGLPPSPRQRIIVDNPGVRQWRGLVEYDPWLECGTGFARNFTLLDGIGGRIVTQDIIPEAASHQMRRTLFPVDIPAGGHQIFELRRLSAPVEKTPSDVTVSGQTIGNSVLSAICGRHGVESLSLNGKPILGDGGIRVGVFEDVTDTWSHGISSYEGLPGEEFEASSPWAVVEDGPLRGELAGEFAARDATLRWAVQAATGSNTLTMRLRLHWRGGAQVVRLFAPAGFRVEVRRDGTPGVLLARPLDGQEYPVMDTVSLAGDGQCLTLVSPDVFGGSVTPDGRAALTLIRSPYYANEGEYEFPAQHGHPLTDQGIHEFEIALIAADKFDEDAILDEAYWLNNPPIISETTDGMPAGRVYRSSLPEAEGAIPYANTDAWLPEELIPFAANPSTLSLVASESVYAPWRGERLVVADGPVALSLPAPESPRCRVALSYVSSGDFGGFDVLSGGVLLASAANSSKAMPGGILVTATPDSATGKLDLEIVPHGDETIALAYVHVYPALIELTAAQCRYAGPFLFRETPEWAANPDVTAVMSSLALPPESAPSFADWPTLPGEGAFIDFHAASGGWFGSIHYAATSLIAETAQTVELAFGVDWWIKIWVNGMVVQDVLNGPGSPFPGQHKVKVDVKPGRNTVLVKVAAGSTGNGFWLSALDSGDLSFSLLA